ncbi:MAG: hypothetical protein K2P94_14525 [Rhodospirillaceae bacterium]|nr:hypothetical protein [Rhodospirillaceae bacterium]
MLASRKLTCLAAGVGALMTVASAQAAEFTGGSFSCLEFTNGMGQNASGRVQSVLARQWILGYLAGYYRTQGKIEYTEDAGDIDKLDTLMVQKCKEFPQATIFAMSAQMLANEPRKLPKNVTADFSPAAYTCGQHVDARNGAAGDANRADLAENWAFAFIQGAKNVATPNMEIRAENKPQLIGVMNKACGNARDTLYGDLAALVAEKVKLQ